MALYHLAGSALRAVRAITAFDARMARPSSLVSLNTLLVTAAHSAALGIRLKRKGLSGIVYL